MADATINENAVTSLYNIEAAIINQFKSMLASDAMLAIDMEVVEIKSLNKEELLGQFSETARVIQSDIEWNGQSGRHFFLFKEDDAQALLEQITQENEALDSLDVVFDNWNLAAVQLLQEKLSQAPTFGEVKVESKALSEEDLNDDDLWCIYQIKLGDKEYQVHRISPAFWQEIAEAANLEVTTVDDIDTNLDNMNVGETQVESVDFGNLNPEMSDDESIGSIEVLYDLKLDLVVELGRTKKPIREILELARGSIIELEKLAGDPVEIYVNDKKLAEGEVVVVDDHFGVRITNLLKPADRIKSLGAS